MLNFIRHIFSIVLVTVLLSQGLMGTSPFKFLESFPMVTEWLGVQQNAPNKEDSDQNELPANGMTNTGDTDSEEIEEEKESLYLRYFDDPLERPYVAVTTQLFAINDSFVASNPLEVIVPPPDQMV